MDWFLIVAGVLASVTTVIHIFVGGNGAAKPLLASSLAAETKYALYACWHFVSGFFVLSTIVLLLAGFGSLEAPGMIVGVSSLWVLFGLVFLFISLWVNNIEGVFKLPQWVPLLSVGLLGFASLA